MESIKGFGQKMLLKSLFFANNMQMFCLFVNSVKINYLACLHVLPKMECMKERRIQRASIKINPKELRLKFQTLVKNKVIELKDK